MTNGKNTKRALISSALAVLMCVSMLIGTTFAWFTDTASTAVNRIQAGTLKVGLEYLAGHDLDGNEIWKSAEGETLDFVKAAGHENEAILWEPGCTYKLPKLRIVNNGNLALKYKVVITGINGDAELNEAIEWTIDSVAQGTEQKLAVGANKEFTISGTMKTTAGNAYQGLSIDGISITVYATQDTVEHDSNNNQYDATATLPSTWDGTLDTQGLTNNTDTQNKTVTIENAAQLAAFAANVRNNNNTYFGYTVTLTSDIDLSGEAWSGIGANDYFDFPSYFFNGTFDGQGHTIYNMTVSSLIGNTATAGFFNGLGNNAIVKNLNFENASVTSNHQAGVVAGYCCTAAGNGVNQEPKAYIENCNVNNSTVVSKAHKTGTTYDDGDKVGGIIGYTFFDVKNCSVKNTTITGYRDIGGIVGYANADGYSTANVTGNTVENVTIYVDKTHDYKTSYVSLADYDANSIVGEKASAAIESNNEGTATVVTTVNATTNNAAEVATALKSTTDTVSVTLTDDVAMDINQLDGYTGGSGQYKLGGTNTTAINIDLNGHKLTLNTTYWSVLGAKNSNAVITVKNGSMNSSQTTGTWNSYDLTFYDCKWNFENVTFDKAVAIATGANVTMKNVVINESHDYYALWITLEGQTVSLDNVTINCPNGRGIAINNQYVANPQQVTLNINGGKVISAHKSAVIVKNLNGGASGVTYTTEEQKNMGANINVSGHFDISGVAADSTNAVWKDSANTSVNVTVTGATVINEAYV